MNLTLDTEASALLLDILSAQADRTPEWVLAEALRLYLQMMLKSEASKPAQSSLF